MPEEINRIITDQVSSMLFTHCEDANENLIKEGISKEKIHFVGNLMIDTLIRLLPIAQSRFKKTIQEIGIKYIDSIKYGLVTLHRPSNVDNIDSLLMIFKTLVDLSNEIPLIFPVHPRTAERLTSLPFNFSNSNVHLTTPLGYLEFLALQERAALVITDSGGVQEKTTFLHVPCITVRKNTERPITISLGTNVLVGNDMMQLLDTAIEILYNKVCACQIPKYWDGNAGETSSGGILMDNKVSKMYSSELLKYGDSSKSVHWKSPEVQASRFEILEEIDDLNRSLQFDIGCGKARSLFTSYRWRVER